MWQISNRGRKLTQSQIAEIQYLGLGSPSLLDPALRFSQIWLHDGSMLASGEDEG